MKPEGNLAMETGGGAGGISKNALERCVSF